ncbi:uncharacterized protein PRCAT00003091001 [Priceomyces carsonii]|uniref:uncharacterized protein n=1 Tax=Priceomyces carsonii TaxID=28549 RepID=UPI002ED92FE4|nr:unnamed protein product [Priceomyces carsonii]
MSSYIDEVAPDDTSSNYDNKSLLGNEVKHLDTVIALYDFPGTQASHLSLKLGDTINVLSKSDTGWLDGIVRNLNGEIVRGWFPNTYVRSVNYVQPVMKKLKNDKEIDSITAANTAANVLIPSFTNLLQKSLADNKNGHSDSTRKNSVVSFASSETSLPSDSRVSQSSYQPQSLTLKLSQIPHDPEQAEIDVQLTHDEPHSSSIDGGSPSGPDFMDIDDVENLVEDYKRENGKTPSWVPRYTTDGNIAFYSDQLRVYCDTIPLTTYKIAEDFPVIEVPKKETLSSNKLVSRGLNDTSNILGHRSDSGSSFDPLKRESNSSNNSQSLGASYHHFAEPFFSMEGLFYSQTSDFAHWTEMRDEFTYLLDLTHIALKENNRQLFATYVFKLTEIVNYIFSATRLIHNDFVGSKYESSVRRKLRRIASSFSQLYITGFLHLSIMFYPQQTSGVELFGNDITMLNKASAIDYHKSQSVDSMATITDKDFLAENLAKSHLVEDKNEYAEYHDRIEYEIHSLKESISSLTKLFLKITRTKRVKMSDYTGSDGSDASDTEVGEDRYNILPELYPRFLSDEFNGGNWCNLFLSSNNPVLNASGDDLKNKSHSKLILDNDTFGTLKALIDQMKTTSSEVLDYLDPDKQHLYYNDTIKSERNNQILRLVYKFMFHASTAIDIMESFDFTVFPFVKKYSITNELPKSSGESEKFTSDAGLMFDYPIILEFFQIKQAFHNLIARIVMSAQSLTLEDPDVFKGINDENPIFYNRSIIKQDSEKEALLLTNILIDELNENSSGSILMNPDTILLRRMKNGINFFDVVLSVTQLLIDERDTILNYATRVMHVDMNVQLLLMERNNTLLSEKSDEGNSFYGGQTRSNSVPWYLEGDEEYDLLLDIKGNVKGGTKEALVCHLTHHDSYDSNFVAAFLLTFSTMMSIGELIELLIARFEIEPPEGLSFEEYNIWISKKQSTIRLRVLNTMKLLLEKHWCNSYKNYNVLTRWLTFTQSSQVQSYSIGKLLVTDLRKVINGEIVCFERVPSQPQGKPPAPLMKTFIKKKMVRLLDIDNIELARQLTIREFKLYSKITRFACLTKVWGKKSGLNESIEDITNFIKESNQLTNFVAYMILRKADIKKRVQIIRYFVQVAEKCRQYNNFSSMTAIISALYSSPIHRLKKTWKFVSSESLSKLQNMNKLMNSSRNFNEYRDVLKFIGSEPCIPFFGVYLSDLTFVFHGNPNFLMNRTRMINFAKRAKTFEIIESLDRFKTTAYNLLEVLDIQFYLGSWMDKCPSIPEQYQISLNLEPRETTLSNTGSSSSTHSSKLQKPSLGSLPFRI